MLVAPEYFQFGKELMQVIVAAMNEAAIETHGSKGVHTGSLQAGRS
jgi:hypothetical protein